MSLCLSISILHLSHSPSLSHSLSLTLTLSLSLSISLSLSPSLYLSHSVSPAWEERQNLIADNGARVGQHLAILRSAEHVCVCVCVCVCGGGVLTFSRPPPCTVSVVEKRGKKMHKRRPVKSQNWDRGGNPQNTHTRTHAHTRACLAFRNTCFKWLNGKY